MVTCTSSVVKESWILVPVSWLMWCGVVERVLDKVSETQV